jgi:hypothetical protein
MRFQIADHDYDLSEVTEVRVATKGFGSVVERTTTLQGEDARLVLSRMFVGPTVNMKDTFVGGFITSQIQLVFKDRAEIHFDVYNDRLAVDRESNTGYYLDAKAMRQPENQ